MGDVALDRGLVARWIIQKSCNITLLAILMSMVVDNLRFEVVYVTVLHRTSKTE
jgi:hypothetical protein